MYIASNRHHPPERKYESAHVALDTLYLNFCVLPITLFGGLTLVIYHMHDGEVRASRDRLGALSRILSADSR